MPLLTLLIAYFIFGSFYALLNEAKEKSGDDLDIMTFNAWGFNRYGWIKEPDIAEKIIDFIKKEDPDILCIQEYNTNYTVKLKQFPHRSLTPYIDAPRRTVQAIFSKYPIVSEGSLDLPNTTNNIIYADIIVKKDTLRIYNMHLQSFSIVPSKKTFSEAESEKNYRRLVNTFSKQQEQAKLFDAHRKSCPYPYVVCGDMNNTQFSNVYTRIRGDLQDTFLDQGSGFGKTYNLLGLPIRIDYVLPHDSFEIIAHRNYKEKLSDHYPVMATLRVKTDP
ncbi:MAG: endonuclease/exonuclease/phosphatase family protein [Bacteroidota bacterium]